MGNLTAWKPGQSGNPTGRPKRKPLTETLLAELSKPHGRRGGTKRDAVMARLVGLALTAKPREAVEAIKLMLAYTDGLPVQTIELEAVEVARKIAEERGYDPERVVSIFEALKARRVS